MSMPHSVLPLLICCLQVVLLAWYARTSPLKIFHLFRSQSDPQIIKEIVDAVTIPVMAKVRIGHFVEAQVEPQLEFVGCRFHYFNLGLRSFKLLVWIISTSQRF